MTGARLSVRNEQRLISSRLQKPITGGSDFRVKYRAVGLHLRV